MNQILDDIRKDAIKCANNKRRNDKTPDLPGVERLNNDTIVNVFKAIGTTLTLAEVVQNEGLFAMDDYLAATNDSLPGNEFFKKIGFLVTKAIEPEHIEEIGTNMYWTKEYKGYHGLVAYTYLRGLLMIQTGIHVHYIEDVLLSILTESELSEYNESNYKWIETEVSYKEYRIEFEDGTTQTLIDYINESFKSMSNDEFKRFLESSNNNDMIVFLPYLTDEAETRFFNNVSERLKNMLIEGAKFQQYVNEKSLRETLLQLVGTIIAAKEVLNK